MTDTIKTSPATVPDSLDVQNNTVRDNPDKATSNRSVGVRKLRMRASTLSESNRTVEAVFTTEAPARVMDYREWEPIDEVLLMAGAEYPEQVPLLDSHQRYSIDDVIGSGRDIRIDGSDQIGTLHFAEHEQGNKALRMARDGHLTDVSVGYKIHKYVKIPKGGEATVAGKPYKAETMPMHVVTKWELMEISLVAIGADKLAKIRAAEWSGTAIEEQIIMEENKTPEVVPVKQEVLQVAPAPVVDLDAVRAEAMKSERARITNIRSLAGDDVPTEMVQRAEAEGWTAEKAGIEFLGAIRASRAEPINTAPELHIKTDRKDIRQIEAGLRLRSGLTYHPANVTEAERKEWELIAEDGQKFASLSMLDMCKEALRMKGLSHYGSGPEIAERAFSSADMLPVYTSNVNASLLERYESADDSTTGFIREADLADFKTNERIIGTKQNGMKRIARGGSAVHDHEAAEMESYKLGSYAKQIVVTFEDVVDDRMDYITSIPGEMGSDARDVKIDLVYAILLGNPTMRDTKALFHTDHKNYATTGSALGDATLQTGIAAMWTQKDNGKMLNIRPEIFLCDPTKVFDAQVLIGSADRTTTTGNMNPIRVVNPLSIVADGRVGGGVVDPSTGTTIAGAAANWFLFAAPRRPTIEVGYLAGTGRRPTVREFQITQGQRGFGWDVFFDVGAKALDWRAMYKATGAS